MDNLTIWNGVLALVTAAISLATVVWPRSEPAVTIINVRVISQELPEPRRDRRRR